MTLIWDLDGTLMDSLTDLWISVNHSLKTYGLPERTKDEVCSFVGNGVRRLMEQASPEGAENTKFEACLEEFKRYYKLHCNDNTAPYQGIKELLAELKRRGIVMAIVSNKYQTGVDEIYQKWFKDTIEIAIGEHEGMKRKPAPDMVFEAMRMLPSDQYIYIGDSDVDITTAKAANIPCISVLWGFRDESFLRSHGANLFAKTPSDILKFID